MRACLLISLLTVSPFLLADPQDPIPNQSKFIDPVDGAFDLSSFLENPKAFLVIPMVITEPAVGYGLGLTAVFLQPREEAGIEGWKRPNITAIGAMKTENGTRGGLLFDSRYWANGRIKTNAMAGAASVNLDFYGFADGASGLNSFEYNLDSRGGKVGGDWIFNDSDWSLSAGYAYYEVEASLRNPLDLPANFPVSSSTDFSAVELAIEFDRRDNFFSPESGFAAKTTLRLNSEAIGASSNFQELAQIVINYWELNSDWILAAKIEARAIFGDYPFYAKPSINQRGVAARRYQGDYALSSELEIQYKLNSRFRVMGFAGLGQTWDRDDPYENDQSVLSGGLGFRYRLARKFGLDMGVDIAGSEETQAIYIQFGSAWLRL